MLIAVDINGFGDLRRTSEEQGVHARTRHARRWIGLIAVPHDELIPWGGLVMTCVRVTDEGAAPHGSGDGPTGPWTILRVRQHLVPVVYCHAGRHTWRPGEVADLLA